MTGAKEFPKLSETGHKGSPISLMSGAGSEGLWGEGLRHPGRIPEVSFQQKGEKSHFRSQIPSFHIKPHGALSRS